MNIKLIYSSKFIFIAMSVGPASKPREGEKKKKRIKCEKQKLYDIQRKENQVNGIHHGPKVSKQTNERLL